MARLMEHDTKTPLYSTSDRSSFAYISARDRWPVILTGAIDDVHRAAGAASDDKRRDEGKRIVSELAKLKYELQHDRELTPIPNDSYDDVVGYNEELACLEHPTWFNVPWLFAECYLYRRLSSIFKLSVLWKDHDVFYRQKISTFKSSRSAVLELAARYKDLMTQLEPGAAAQAPSSPEEKGRAEELLFKEMCEICLWGNATDLSLLTSLTYEDIQKLQGSEARKHSEKNILVDDLPAAYNVLKSAQTNTGVKSRRVDIVLDNAGFELFVDLILAGYLLSAKLATTIVLHPKSIPWFVSDVIPADFSALLNALADPRLFYDSPDEHSAGQTPPPLSDKEVEQLSFLFQHWSGLHQEGKLIIRPNRFWTHGGSYWRLPSTEPSLFEDLKESELVIFKGDLNYRKLTADAMWKPTTPFATVIGPLGQTSGLRTLALRTCKADVVVGLPEGLDEKLRASEQGKEDTESRKWAWSGKWAVVQFHDGKGESDG